MKRSLAFLCLSLFLLNTASASSVKLLTQMVNSSGLAELLVRYDVKGADKTQLEKYIMNSLSSFSGKKPNEKEFAELLNRLPVFGEDIKMKQELQNLLDKSSDQIKKEDFVMAVNNLIYLANRYGKSVVITCADCVNGSLAKQGFKFTADTITNPKLNKILQTIVPSNPQDLHIFIYSKSKRYRLGDYSKISPGVMSKEDEKTFALFLASYESGSDEFKNLAKKIVDLSTERSITNMFNPENPNKIWRVVTTDMPSNEVKELISVLEDAKRFQKEENLNAEDAFNKALRRKTKGRKELVSKYRAIKSKRCFFR